MVIIFLLSLFSILSNSGLINRIKNKNFKKIEQETYLLAEVMEAKNFLKNSAIKDFNLSEGIKQEPSTYQRMIEVLYPIRMNEKSKIIFFIKNEILPTECKNLYRSEKLFIYECNK